MGAAIKYPVPDRVKPPFVSFDIRALLTLSPERQSARISKITNDCLTQCGTGCFVSCTHVATMGVKGTNVHLWSSIALRCLSGLFFSLLEFGMDSSNKEKFSGVRGGWLCMRELRFYSRLH